MRRNCSTSIRRLAANLDKTFVEGEQGSPEQELGGERRIPAGAVTPLAPGRLQGNLILAWKRRPPDMPFHWPWRERMVPSQFFRPLLPAMKHSDELQVFAAGAIRDDVWSARNNEFSRPHHAARPAHLWLRGEQVNAPWNSGCNGGCVLRTVFCDVVANHVRCRIARRDQTIFTEALCLQETFPAI